MKAAEEGNADRVLHLIHNRQADLDHKYEHGFTVLHHAAFHGHADVVDTLLKRGADVNEKSSTYGTPLCLAAIKGRCDVARLLLIKKAHVLGSTKGIGTALHCASWAGNEEIVSLLVDNYYADVNSKHRIIEARLESLSSHERSSVLPGEPTDSKASSIISCWPLTLAVLKNRIGVVRLLLQAGSLTDEQCEWSSPDQSNEDYPRKATPLMIAAEKGFDAILQLLIDYKANVNCQDDMGRSVLAIAARNGHSKCVIRLLRANAIKDISDKEGETALHLAVIGGHLECVRAFKDEAKGMDFDVSNAKDHSPLRVAAQLGDAAIAQILLASGAQVDSKSSIGSSPLTIAAENRHKEVVALLLRHGANVSTPKHDGTTPFRAALNFAPALDGEDIDNGHFILEALLRSKNIAPISENDIKDILAAFKSALKGKTSSLEEISAAMVLAAARGGDENALKALQTVGADLNARFSDGQTALHRAAHDRDFTAAMRLLNLRASVNEYDRRGFTPLMNAIKERQVQMVEQMVVHHGALVNDRARSGFAPIHFAVKCNATEILATLLRNKADTSVQESHHGDTPLHLAAREDHLEAARLLLEHHASMRAANHDGHTAKDVASEYFHFDVEELLEKHEELDKLAASVESMSAKPLEAKDDSVPQPAVAEKDGPSQIAKVVPEERSKSPESSEISPRVSHDPTETSLQRIASGKSAGRKVNAGTSLAQSPRSGADIDDKADFRSTSLPDESAHDPEKLRNLVYAAQARAREGGKPELEKAFQTLYEGSLKDSKLRTLLEAVLAQKATREQKSDFEVYVDAASDEIRDTLDVPRPRQGVDDREEPNRQTTVASPAEDGEVSTLVADEDLASVISSTEDAEAPLNAATTSGSKIPARSSDSADTPEFSWPGILCDGPDCESKRSEQIPISGVRYKCKTCSQVNLCCACKTSHEQSHHFQKMGYKMQMRYNARIAELLAKANGQESQMAELNARDALRDAGFVGKRSYLVNPNKAWSHAMELIDSGKINLTRDMIKLLLDHNAPIDSTDGGRTMLHLVTAAGDIAAADLLIRRGANVNAPVLRSSGPNHLDTPLHIAVKRVKPAMVQLLLCNDARTESRSSLDRTAMHYVFLHWNAPDSLDILSLLLEHGASAAAVDQNNETPSLIATQNGLVGAMQVVFEAEVKLTQVTGLGHTSLGHIANKNDDADMAELFLLEAISNGLYVKSALLQAAMRGAWSVVLRFVQLKKKHDHENERGSSSQIEVGSRIATPEDTIKITDKGEGFTKKRIFQPVGRAASERPSLGEIDVNAKSEYRWSVLHYLARASEPQIDACLEELILAGADINAQDRELETPLHVAAFSGKPNMVKILKKFGADASLKDCDGNTALDWAIRTRRKEIVELLGGKWKRFKIF